LQSLSQPQLCSHIHNARPPIPSSVQSRVTSIPLTATIIAAHSHPQVQLTSPVHNDNFPVPFTVTISAAIPIQNQLSRPVHNDSYPFTSTITAIHVQPQSQINSQSQSQLSVKPT
ncbi:hypothetical protein ACJMK2_021269, partial [Sinanodonta woodiana]